MNQDSAILASSRLLWAQGMLPLPAELRAVHAGEFDPATGNFTDAEVHASGSVYRGTVVFCDTAEYVPCEVMRVSAREDAPQEYEPGTPLLRIQARPGERMLALYRRMRSGRETCARAIAAQDPAKRIHLFSRLYEERTERKCAEMLHLWEEGQRDWNHVLYVGLFMGMGGSAQKELYMQVAHRVPYRAVAHHKASRREVEAMLLGASGLLQTWPDDDYSIALKQDFDYLCNRWNIRPMEAGRWGTEKSQGYVAPALRLVQMAGFLCTREFIFDEVRSCRTPQDIYNLFREEVSDYWVERYSSSRLDRSTCTIGRAKMDLMGINLVVPLMAAYASVTGDVATAAAAQDLICLLRPEKNAKIHPWTASGVELQNGADSQALLELNNEYCEKTKCPACPVGRKLIKTLNNEHTIEHY